MIPDFQTLMLPLLKELSDGKEHTLRDIINTLSDKYNLDKDERTVLLPSGNQPVIDNRIGWARTYLKKAGLLKYPKRGSLLITKAGKEILASPPLKINIAFLKTLPVFKEWQYSYSIPSEDTYAERLENFERIPDEALQNITITPSEQIDLGYQQIYDNLSGELLEKLKKLTDKQFEKLVLRVLIAMGYGGFKEDSSEHTGKSNDGGIDGLIKEDKLGLDIIYIQVKQFRNTVVPIAAIRDFAGSLLSKKSKKGIFITLSSFPATAIEFLKNIDQRIVLINGTDLAQLMIEYNVGVSIKKTIELKDLDNDFFEEI